MAVQPPVTARWSVVCDEQTIQAALLRLPRRHIEQVAAVAIDLLDGFDGDSDLEPEAWEADGDLEPEA